MRHTIFTFKKLIRNFNLFQIGLVSNYCISDGKGPIEQGKNLCVIYETEEIKNRYQGLLNSKVRLLARRDFKNILQVLINEQPAQVISNVINKYQ